MHGTSKKKKNLFTLLSPRYYSLLLYSYEVNNAITRVLHIVAVTARLLYVTFVMLPLFASPLKW